MVDKYNKELENVVNVIIKRWEVLEVLSGTALTKPDLESSLDVSRSTVNRAVSELVGAGVIERASGKYRFTSFGQPVYHLFSRTWRSLDGVHRARSLSPNLPSGEHGEGVVFDGATITQAAPHEPDRALRSFLSRVHDVDSIRGYSPVVLRQYVDVFHEQVMQGSLELELVITTNVRDCLETNYIGQFKEVLRQPDVQIFETAEPVTYGLTLFKDGSNRKVALVLYSETGVSGYIANNNDLAVSWAAQVYQNFKEEATRIDL